MLPTLPPLGECGAATLRSERRILVRQRRGRAARTYPAAATLRSERRILVLNIIAGQVLAKWGPQPYDLSGGYWFHEAVHGFGKLAVGPQPYDLSGGYWTNVVLPHRRPHTTTPQPYDLSGGYWTQCASRRWTRPGAGPQPYDLSGGYWVGEGFPQSGSH